MSAATQVQPALGACHIGISAGVNAALCWVASDTCCIAHGMFISWCDRELKERSRLTLAGHVAAIAAFSDGGLAACVSGVGVCIIDPRGCVVRELALSGAQSVVIREGAASSDFDVAVLRSVKDAEHGYDYTIAERYSANATDGVLYGDSPSLESYLSTSPDVSPCLGLAVGREWWGLRLRPLNGPAGELKREGFSEHCLIDRDWVVLGGENGLEKVHLQTGEVAARLDLPNDGGVRLARRNGRLVARIDRKRLLLLSQDLEVLEDRGFGSNLVGGVPSPDTKSWLLAYCPDDVSPRQLAMANDAKKPTKLKSDFVPALSVALDAEAMYLGGKKWVMRLSAGGLLVRDIGAGNCEHLARSGSALLAFGNKLVVADATDLKSEAPLKFAAGFSASIWNGEERLVAFSGGRRAELELGEVTEHKLRSPVKHTLVSYVGGEFAFVDNMGWVSHGKAKAVRLLKLEEDEWYPSAVSRDGRLWAIDWKARGVRLWSNAGRSPLHTIPAKEDASVICMAFNPEGTWIALGRVGELQLVEVGGGRTLSVSLPGQCISVAFSHSGNSVTTVLGTHIGGPFADLVEGEVRAFDTDTLAPLFRLLAAKSAALAVGPQGQVEAHGDIKAAAALAVSVTNGAVAKLTPTAGSALLASALR